MNCPYCVEEIEDGSEKCPLCKSEIIKACPFCFEKIKANALKCRHCGSALDGAPQAQLQAAPMQQAPQNFQTIQPTQLNSQAKLKSQTVAAILCALIGGFGAHRFYLGPVWVGVAYLLLFWTGIPGLIAMVEIFIIAFSSQDTWAKKHNNGVITPPTHILVKILVLIFPLLAILGILAAIAIPQFSAFKTKANNSIALSDMRALKTTLENNYAEKKSYPESLEAIGYKGTADVSMKCSLSPESYVCVSAHKKGTIMYTAENNSVKIEEQPYKAGEALQLPYRSTNGGKQL